MKRRIAVVVVVLAIFVPLATWFPYKPVRVFVPHLAGMTCPKEQLCVEKIESPDAAEQLYTQAHAYVSSTISKFERPPKFLFCKTQSCFENFGFKKASAQSLGTVATVVGPNGWAVHTITHEMIHHIQNEKLGSLKFLSMPTWFVEGMAYALSEDPRSTLQEPWESHRRTFRDWHQSIGVNDLWDEAGKL